MKKDSFYFPHFCNARHDRKIKRLTKQLGVEGYGIYFMLLEVLREQTDLKYPLSDVDLLADEFGTSEAKIKTVITGYELFQFDETGKFFSIKQIYYLQPYFERSEKQREKALKRWGKAGNDATALPRESHGYATKVKETKLKETKVNEIESHIQTFGTHSNEFIIIKSPYINSVAYRINGVEGLREFLEANMSQLNYPEYAQKFMRSKSGDQYNDLQHLRNAYFKFIEKQQ